MTEAFARAWQHELAKLKEPQEIYWATSIDDEWHVFDTLQIALDFAGRNDEMGVPMRHKSTVRPCRRATPLMTNAHHNMIEEIIVWARQWSDFETGEHGPFLADEEAEDELCSMLSKTFDRWLRARQGRGVWIYAWRFAGEPRYFERHSGRLLERAPLGGLLIPPELDP